MTLSFFRHLLVLLILINLTSIAFSAPSSSQVAQAVIERRFGKEALKNVQLLPLDGAVQTDTFEFQAAKGKLIVRGSSPIALTSGWYQYIRRNGLGMATWNGTRLDLTKPWPDAPPTRVSTPFKYRYYLNVVTYGYSTPYWTWERWQQEIDWMALHGINMPLALVGTEAISARVWKKFGLTQDEINTFFTGPAYLPWQRMGNISRHDGPFPMSWNTKQIALQHKILDQMRGLGMQPIVPGFAGFVPKGVSRLYPDAKIHAMRWGGFGPADSAYLLDANSPQFAELGKSFVQEWEQEFGKFTYYLADSFNEMDLPTKDPEQKKLLLAQFGKSLYKAIEGGNPSAVWVVQGWMLGFQRNIWNKEALEALASKVPDDKMLILDLAEDYNTNYWHNGKNWDVFTSFAGKPWVYSVIPNMGGKTAWTGYMDYYARGGVEALQSPNRGNLVGSGFAMEGIENNEALYELLSDMLWRKEPMNLDEWTKSYSLARYGAYPPAMKTAWELLRQSAYNSFTDHPKFNWQNRGQVYGSVNSDPRFFAAVEAFLSCADELKNSPLYRADAVELAAFYLGLKAEADFRLQRQALQREADSPETQKVFEHGIQTLRDLDRLLASHPTNRLDRWIDFARANGSDTAEKDYYEGDARRIITQWGGGIRDYSARVWSGLIRDFYIPRLEAENAALRAGQSFDFDNWEKTWLVALGTSPLEPFSDPVKSAQQLVQSAKAWQPPAVPGIKSPFEWKSGQVGPEWTNQEWEITPKITKAGNIRALFIYTSGAHRLDISLVELFQGGQVVARDEHNGTTGLSNRDNIYKFNLPAFQAGAKYTLRARVRADGGKDSNGDIFILTK